MKKKILILLILGLIMGSAIYAFTARESSDAFSQKVAFNRLTPGEEYRAELVITKGENKEIVKCNGEDLRQTVVFTPSVLDRWSNTYVDFNFEKGWDVIKETWKETDVTFTLYLYNKDGELITSRDIDSIRAVNTN